MSKAIEDSLAKANERSELKSDTDTVEMNTIEKSVAHGDTIVSTIIDHEQCSDTITEMTLAATPTRVTRRNLKPKIDSDFDYETDDSVDVTMVQHFKEEISSPNYDNEKIPGKKKRVPSLPHSQDQYEVMEEEEVYINSMMSMSRQQFIALNEDDEKKQLSPSQWAVKSEPATVSQFPRSYSHDEIDEEIFHTLCMNEMEIS